MRRALLFLLLPILLAGRLPEAKSLPDRQLKDLEGVEHELAAFSAEGPFLLDFWATWCLPCRQAFPAYAALREKYAEHGFQVITVSQDNARARRRIAPLFEKLDLSFPVLLDEDASLGDEMGVLNLPTSFLVDAEGRVVWSHTGFVQGDEKELENELRALLKLD